MLRAYSHTKSESSAQIHTIMAEIQHFSRGLFFIGTPCRNTVLIEVGPTALAYQHLLVSSAISHLTMLGHSYDIEIKHTITTTSQCSTLTLDCDL